MGGENVPLVATMAMEAVLFVACLVAASQAARTEQTGGRAASGSGRAFRRSLRSARSGYEGASSSYPPLKAFEPTAAVPYWSQERDGRLLDGLMSPEVAQKEWLRSRKTRLERAEYWKAYDRLLHEGVPLLFGEGDVGSEVAFEAPDRISRGGGSRRVHVLREGGGGGGRKVVESVVAEVGGAVAFRDGTVVENGLAEHRKTPYFKYVDMQTFEEPEWGSRDSERFREVQAGKSGYHPFRTDAAAAAAKKGRRRKGSEYTRRLKERLPDMQSYDLPALAERTGVPEWVLRKVFDKGMAAWRSGHRPGASQHAWAHARVHSFLALGCTVFANDDGLAAEAAEEMSDEQLAEWTGQELACPAYKLKRAYFQRAVKRLRGSRFLEALCDGGDDASREHVCR